jgi:hypothetical protein
MIRAAVWLLPVLILVGVGLARSCSGPRPELVSAHMRGRVVEAVIRNAANGEGEIQIEFRMRPREGGVPLLKSRKATLRPHETARIEEPVDGANGDEMVEVDLEYPPR